MLRFEQNWQNGGRDKPRALEGMLRTRPIPSWRSSFESLSTPGLSVFGICTVGVQIIDGVSRVVDAYPSMEIMLIKDTDIVQGTAAPQVAEQQHPDGERQGQPACIVEGDAIGIDRQRFPVIPQRGQSASQSDVSVRSC